MKRCTCWRPGRDIRYHLAAVLYKSGAPAQARKELEALVAGERRFTETGEVRSLPAEVKRGAPG